MTLCAILFKKNSKYSNNSKSNLEPSAPPFSISHKMLSSFTSKTTRQMRPSSMKILFPSDNTFKYQVNAFYLLRDKIFEDEQD